MDFELEEKDSGNTGGRTRIIAACIGVIGAVIGAIITSIIGPMIVNNGLPSQLVELQREIAALTTENARLQTDITQKEQTINTQNQTIADKDAEIARQGAELEENAQTIRTQNDTIAELKEQLETFSHTHTGDPDIWLHELTHYTSSGSWAFVNDGNAMDNRGNAYSHAIATGTSGNSITFDLNGQYDWIAGTLYQVYNAPSGNNETRFTIYADEVRIWSGTMRNEKGPVRFEENLNHASKLKITYQFDGSGANHAALANVGLWTE